MSYANVAKAADLDGATALQNKFTFWYHRRSAKNIDYNESTKPIASFSTVEQFWQIYDHVVRPNEFKVTTDYHLFKEGIKPTWEEPANIKGGKWMVRLRKGLASRYWEELVLAIVGEQFDVGQEICGAVVSVRTSEDIISIWNRNPENAEATNKIRDQMRKILKLPSFISIEYKKHSDSKADGSSFRNPTMVWKAGGRGEGGAGGRGGEGGGGGRGGGGGGGGRFGGNSHQQSQHYAAGGGDARRSDDHSYAGPKSAWKPSMAPPSSTGDPTRDREAQEAYKSSMNSGTRPTGDRGGGGGSGVGGGQVVKNWSPRSAPPGGMTARPPMGGGGGEVGEKKTSSKGPSAADTTNVWRRGSSIEKTEAAKPNE